MRVIAANWATVRTHRDRLKAHPFIGAQVADKVAVVGVQCRFLCQIKVVAVFHQELTPAHHAEARPNLIAEFPLDVVQRQRQVLVAGHMAAEDIGDQLFVRGAVQHITAMAVGDAQHLFAVIIIPPAFAPQIRRLQRWHQQWDMTCAFLLFVDDLLNPFEHLKAQRQPRIDAGLRLLDHARAQHVAVADNLRLGRRFFENGQEITAQAHGKSPEKCPLALAKPTPGGKPLSCARREPWTWPQGCFRARQSAPVRPLRTGPPLHLRADPV